jgi:hypothetical protein
MAKYYLLLEEDELDFILDFDADSASLDVLLDYIEDAQLIIEEAPVVPEDEL